MVNGSQTVNFYYDATGRRTQKSIGTTHYEYLYDGDKLLQMSVQTPGSWDHMTFAYDSQGVIGFNYKGKDYIYVRNLFGDITDIYCEDHCVAKYTYDAWGNCVAEDLSGIDEDSVHDLNPFRYRGYVFDEETNLYYCNSRYYSPEWGRFINADTLDYLDPETIGGLNLYAYCGNNPVMGVDPSGNFVLWVFLGVVAISALAGAIDGGVTAAISGQNFWKGFAAGAIGGAVGGVINYFLPGAGNLLGRAASTMIYDITNEIFQTGTFDINNLGIYVADTIMDVGLSMLYLDKVGSIVNPFISTAVCGTIDASVDIIQTPLFFSPQAQQRIGEALTKIKELIQHRNRWRYAD